MSQGLIIQNQIATWLWFWCDRSGSLQGKAESMPSSGTASTAAGLQVAHVTKGAWAMTAEITRGENPSDFQPVNSTY